MASRNPRDSATKHPDPSSQKNNNNNNNNRNYNQRNGNNSRNGQTKSEQAQSNQDNDFVLSQSQSQSHSQSESTTSKGNNRHNQRSGNSSRTNQKSAAVDDFFKEQKIKRHEPTQAELDNEFLKDHLSSHDHRANTSRSYQKSRTVNKNEQTSDHQTPSEVSPPSSSMTRRRSKLISTCSSTGANISCICCLHDLQTYVYYSCMHAVCLNCATKMRVICQKNDCPICRKESPKVYCTKTPLNPKETPEGLDSLVKKSNVVIQSISHMQPIPSVAVPEMDKTEYLKIKTSGIFFDDELIREEYNEMLSSACSDCDEVFRSFDDLEAHIRRRHKKFYCELCLENLKLFPYERKSYTREELGSHKRKGDKDDHSFKGHPLCSYCDERFYDKDDLYRHFRRDHYYCHFCDSDGQEEYYADYAELRTHFLKSHFLCELDECSKNASVTHEYVVFRNDLDLQAHKKQTHAKSKSEAKSLGKLNIEFAMTRAQGSRVEQNRESNSGGGGAAGAGRGRNKQRQNQERSNVNASMENNEDASKHGNHGKRSPEIDPNVLQQSKAQFLRDEEDRHRKSHTQTLKEQYERYEQENPLPQATIKVESPAEVAKKEVNEREEEESATQSMWRNVIGQGNAPKINKEAEFPSLVSEGGPKLGYGPLGFQKKQQSLTAWGGKAANAAPELPQKQALSKKQAKKEKMRAAAKEQEEAKAKIPNTSESAANRLNLQAISAATTSPVTSNMQDLKKYLDKSPKDQVQRTVSPKSEPKLEPKLEAKVESRVEPKSTIKPQENKSEFQIMNEDDFPPPGFTSANRPPGFNTAPPGFQTKPKPKPTASLPESECDYIKPEDYTSRNQTLTKKLTNMFGIYYEQEFERFKEVSGTFQRSEMTAEQYLNKCCHLLDFLTDMSQFYDLVQEMIVLLPDSDKQQDLYSAFVKMIDTTGNKAKKSKLNNKLIECQFCCQYFLNSEFNFHQSNYHKKDLAALYAESAAAAKAEVKKTPVRNTTQTDTKKIHKTEDFPSLMSTVTPTNPSESQSYKQSYVFAKPKSQFQFQANGEKPISEVVNQFVDDFPSLGNQEPKKTAQTVKTFDKSKPTKKVEKLNSEEEFPALGGMSIGGGNEPRYSAMPSASIFSNPSQHLSVLNKKKHRLQK